MDKELIIERVNGYSALQKQTIKRSILKVPENLDLTDEDEVFNFFMEKHIELINETWDTMTPIQQDCIIASTEEASEGINNDWITRDISTLTEIAKLPTKEALSLFGDDQLTAIEKMIESWIENESGLEDFEIRHILKNTYYERIIKEGKEVLIATIDKYSIYRDVFEELYEFIDNSDIDHDLLMLNRS